MYAIATLRYRNPPEEQEGPLIASGPIVPRNGGMLLLRVPDDEAQGLSTVSVTTIRSRGLGSRNMKCGPGPRRVAPRNSTACKRTC